MQSTGGYFVSSVTLEKIFIKIDPMGVENEECHVP